MQIEADPGRKGTGLGAQLLTLILRIALPIAILAAAFAVMYWGFIFLRESAAPKWLIVLVAIVWGVGGVAALYWIFNWIVERMGDPWRARLQPFVFVGPAAAMLLWFLAIPVLRTFWLSLFGRDGPPRDWLNWSDLGGSFAVLGEQMCIRDSHIRHCWR